MRDLHIVVNNKNATYLNRDGSIVCGNSNYQIVFTFDSEWDDHELKTARFIWNGKYCDVVFSGDTVPVPVLTDTTVVMVGVYAGDLYTTTPALITCQKSILCSTGEATEATPNIDLPLKDLVNEVEELKRRMAEGTITVDSTLSETSENPVQNKVVTAMFNTWESALNSAILPRLMPTVTEADNGKFLRVVEGAWAAVAVDSAEEASF